MLEANQFDNEYVVDCRQAVRAIIHTLTEAKRFKPGDKTYLLHERPSPIRELSQEEQILLEERRSLLEWQGEIIREYYGG